MGRTKNIFPLSEQLEDKSSLRRFIARFVLLHRNPRCTRHPRGPSFIFYHFYFLSPPCYVRVTCDLRPSTGSERFICHNFPRFSAAKNSPRLARFAYTFREKIFRLIRAFGESGPRKVGTGATRVFFRVYVSSR